MINGIWCGLIVIGVIVSMFTGKIQAVTDSAISSAGTCAPSAASSRSSTTRSYENS